MSAPPTDREPRAVEVSFTQHSLRVILADGREIAAPLEWFPRLLNATPRQRRDWSLVGGGIGIHWEGVDEDISVESLLTPEKMIWARGYGPSLSRIRGPRSGSTALRAFRPPLKNGRRVLKAGA